MMMMTMMMTMMMIIEVGPTRKTKPKVWATSKNCQGAARLLNTAPGSWCNATLETWTPKAQMWCGSVLL